ncbi:FAD-binding domain-containing protein [Ramaria rubella]|nr:FAD-binding domain-containing protein [Ramaria rubella]
MAQAPFDVDEAMFSEDLASFNTNWMGKYHEVSAVVEYCFNNDIAMVPQGENTGLVLVGMGWRPVFDQFVINLANMNKIRSFDKVSGIVTYLGAKGSCQIGGNVATNAGGLRVIPYGTLRGTVLGLEVVLPDGRILDSLNTPQKYNTGFDLHKALFYRYEILSAFEFFDLAGHKIQQSHALHPISINKDHNDEKLTSFQDLLNSETIIDGVLEQDNTQFASLWQLREGITEAAGKTGKVFKYDVSLPASMYELVNATRYRLRELGLYSGEGGHSRGCNRFGDGNLHLNIIVESYTLELQNALESFVYEFVSKYRGSISADLTHRLGLQKAPDIGYSQEYLNIELMRKF